MNASPESSPLVVVDGANVVGSVPDGWWLDRFGAAERLRDRLAGYGDLGLPARVGLPPWAAEPPLELVLVVEGAARGVASVAGVRVVPAAGSGDDAIVELVAEAARHQPSRRCLVVTADRELRQRVERHGAVCAGPRAVRPGTGADGAG
ncbi:NTP pyrophosphohydrolase [Streptomyces sp. TP-A0874]|uniref:NTP pyrophosphohydrolase n=1 Tax=Streptomyces sp. TP-A0874 TaxID=549819 RepID=UPI000853CF72|nr:NTP pyrophosphohydrolase [Streptomyces sp. TP-A0874]